MLGNENFYDMKSHILIFFTLFLLFGKISNAQTLDGDWKGISVCQIKNSSCHDEIVVYHISKNNGNDLYLIKAGKLIEGKENDMGTLNFSFDPKQKTLFSIDSVQQVKWDFKVTEKEMHGTLIYKGKLFRIIDLKKED
jgi:hypothetical protein